MSIIGSIEVLAKEQHARGTVTLPDPAQTSVDALIGYEPRALQQQISSELRRFNVIVVHRRFGKTVMCIRELIDRALHCPFPNGRYAYLAPTYSMAEDIAWLYLLDYTKDIPGVDIQISKLAVTIPTYGGGTARIRLYGVDSPKQRLRGLYLDGVVFDETPLIPMSVWTQQVRPMLSDSNRAGKDGKGRINQWAVFTGTPMGRNHFHKLYNRARMWMAGDAMVDEDGLEIRRNDWAAFLYRASETGVLTRTELADAKNDMDDDEYEQEYQCSFDAAVRGSFYGSILAEIRAEGRVGVVPIVTTLDMYTGWDLGLDDATAVWFAQLAHGELRIVDFYETNNSSFEHFRDVLLNHQEKYRYRFANHYFPHDVEVREMSSGKTRRARLRELGIRATPVPKVSDKQEHISAVRFALKKSWFDESRTADGRDRLALYRREFDDKNQVFRQIPLHDWTSHAADAFATLAMGLNLKRGDPGEIDYEKAIF